MWVLVVLGWWWWISTLFNVVLCLVFGSEREKEDTKTKTESNVCDFTCYCSYAYYTSNSDNNLMKIANQKQIKSNSVIFYLLIFC